MLRRTVIAALLACLAAARPAQAHPHVFVDVGLRFETDAQGRLAAVEVTWAYDGLFTLLILSDYGLDGDGDMVLTGQEQSVLMGFDLADWPDGFDGALFIEGAAGRVPLGPAEPLALTIVDGHLVTRHRRPLGPVTPDGLVVRPYDPSYYAALSLAGKVELPENCAGRIEAADRSAADALVESLGGAGNEAAFEEVQVGVHYSDTLVITCSD